jgi:hypothetical protein
MTTDLPPEDQAVLDDLTAALTARRDVQSRHREAAQAAFTWRTVDAELMELAYDSLDEPSTVRGVVSAQPRALSFTSRRGSLEVEVDGDRVRGHVVPAAVVTVIMTNAAGERAEATTDEDGMFVLMGTLPGPVRFTVEGDVGGTTPWVTL